ncbi:isocitrate lyase/PEP mutase family protein [Bradyrhizobium genosp. A]|uniref:isocitrate lyase/PEP mutase family protein n=1 Tax=Bradyrhizobium genosp. A TaxID=83626 RepID=UPI003CEB5782
MTTTSPARFRHMLRTNRLLALPGVYDGITARLSEQRGFNAIYMTGAGTAMSFGFPDFGLLTMNEMAGRASVIAQSVAIPLIADADTGYGNELNVTRTVRDYERGGVAGLHIEDQVSPKRCGHLDGKEIVPRDEFVSKIRAAVAARRDKDFFIIARTDARAVAGFDEAIDRANAALAAGADMAFVEATESLDEMAAVPQRVNGPCLLNIVRGGKTPDVNLRDVEDMGYRVAILPSLLLGAAIEAFDRALAALLETNTPPESVNGASLVRDRFRRFGADEWDALRTRFREQQRQDAES